MSRSVIDIKEARAVARMLFGPEARVEGRDLHPGGEPRYWVVGWPIVVSKRCKQLQPVASGPTLSWALTEAWRWLYAKPKEGKCNIHGNKGPERGMPPFMIHGCVDCEARAKSDFRVASARIVEIQRLLGLAAERTKARREHEQSSQGGGLPNVPRRGGGGPAGAGGGA